MVTVTSITSSCPDILYPSHFRMIHSVTYCLIFQPLSFPFVVRQSDTLQGCQFFFVSLLHLSYEPNFVCLSLCQNCLQKQTQKHLKNKHITFCLALISIFKPGYPYDIPVTMMGQFSS